MVFIRYSLNLYRQCLQNPSDQIINSSLVNMQVRKLLHHFPRTYADLQNSRDAIDDGQYLIFVGTVLSSR